MKKIITTLLVSSMLFLTGCKDEKKEEVKTAINTSETIPAKKPVKASKTKTLAQQGNYSQLFNREPKDCGFISEEIIAASFQVKKELIKQGYNTCTYHLTEENGQEIRFNFIIENWGIQKIRKEIKMAKESAENFGKNSLLSQYRISETGDTYLSMHQNRMVRILNEESDTVIVILYNPKIDPAEEDHEKRKNIKADARAQAYALANYLLNTHKS